MVALVALVALVLGCPLLGCPGDTTAGDDAQVDAGDNPTTTYRGDRVVSMVVGETRTASVLVENAVSHRVEGLPDWATLDSDSGVLTLSPGITGHDVFTVEADTATGTEVFESILRISVFPREEDIPSRVDAMPAEDIEELVQTKGAIALTSPQFFKNPDGDTWTVCLAYFPEYDVNQQIITVDLSTGLVGVNDTTLFKDESWHQFVSVPGPNNTSYINPKGDALIRVHAYDTASHTWSYDVAGTREDHRGSGQPSKIAVGTNGNIYSLGRTPTGDLSVLEVDPNNNNSTRFFTDISANGDVVAVAADDLYAYTLDSPYDVRTLTAIGLDTDERTVIHSNAGAQIYQRKHGVVLLSGGTWSWVHHGQVLAATDLNTSPPWGPDETDLYETSTHYPAPAPLEEFDTIGLIPAESNTGKFWFVDPNGTPDLYTSVDVPNIIKYPETLRVGLGLSNGKILFAADGYNGYSLFDPSTSQLDKYITAISRISNYAVCGEGELAYLSGYFGGPVLKYDITSEWDNTVNDLYDPNTPVPWANPEYLGPLGNDYNFAKTFSCAIGADHKAYFGGERVRSGVGGGVAIYDPDTDAVTGHTEGFADENVRNVVRTGSYVVTSSYSDSGTNPIRLVVLDTRSGAIARTIEPAGDITANAGRLCGPNVQIAQPDDAPAVFLLTETDDELTSRIIKVDVESGEVLFDVTLPFPNDAGGYNDNGRSDILMAGDGFLYATVNPSQLLIRMDPETGLYEPIRKLNQSAGRFDAIGADLYVCGTTWVRKISDITVSLGF